VRFYGGSTAFYGVAEAVAFYEGGSVSPLVPDTFTVAIDGRPYMVDLSQPFYRQYHRQLAPLIRTQADTSKEPGEQSMDPNGLWRRSFDDWQLGAGQRYLDRSASVDNGFWQSKGVDALSNRWQLSLLPDTALSKPEAFTNLSAVTANGNTYIAFNTTLFFLPISTVTGTPGTTISSLCTDGNTVWAACGADGIYSLTAGTSTCTQYTTSAIGSNAVIGFVNGRLMLGNNYDGTHGDGKLYNITTSGALPTALMAPASGNATVWSGFAEGNSFLYAAAQVGDKGLIYGVTVLSDGSALSAPSVQGQLPNGESITAIYGYLGNLIIGSSLGVRFATASTTGVTIGSLISGQVNANSYGPTSAVKCFTGYGRWVWFGWTNYDTGSTGLGRLDLENFVIENDLPAFQSDIMYSGQGAVVCVTPYQTGSGVGLYFGVSGVGFVTSSGPIFAPTQFVSKGTITSGYILYDLADPKIASLVDVQTLGPVTSGNVVVSLSADTGPFLSYALINSTSTTPYSFALPGVTGTRFEVQITLNRDGTLVATTPLLSRWTLRAYPAPVRPITWQLPLILDELVTSRSSSSRGFDPLVELQALETMATNGLPVVYQESNEAFTVFVQDVEFLPDALTEDHHYFNGIALVTLEGLPVPYTSH
jgi:hypothetical protein